MDHGLTCAAAAARNLDAATPLRSAEICATVTEIAGPKSDLGAKARKKRISKLFLHGTLQKRKSPPPNWRKIADKSPSQPGCCHSNMICDAQLQTTIVVCAQPQQRGTLMQPLQSDLRRQVASRSSCIYARGNTRWQHSFSNCTVIGHRRFQKTFTTSNISTAARCKTNCIATNHTLKRTARNCLAHTSCPSSFHAIFLQP